MREVILRQFDMLRKMRQLNLADSLNTMPQGEFMVLHELLRSQKIKSEKGATISELANLLQVSPPAVSRTLKKLEQKGYAQRITDTSDRRNTYVYVTDEGNAAFRHCTLAMSGFMEKVFSHLEDSELEQYFLLSEKIYDAIKLELKSLT